MITLKLIDRIFISDRLPKVGKFEDLIVIQDIKGKISITQEEIEKHKIRTEITNGLSSMKWEHTEDTFDYDFTDLEKGMIAKILKQISDAEALPEDVLELYKKFC